MTASPTTSQHCARAASWPANWQGSQRLSVRRCGRRRNTSAAQRQWASKRTRAPSSTRCRVYGIENLWVIDGSILPAITSRGPHATIVMIGHRAAEFVV